MTADAVGYLASGLVFAAFCMKEMIPLRVIAVCSNLAFIAYGIELDLHPIWLLHTILLPMNCLRLWQLMPGSGRPGLTAPRFGEWLGRLHRSRLQNGRSRHARGSA